MNEPEVANVIFNLRKEAALFLRAGDTAAYARIQDNIARLQTSNPSAVVGRGKEEASYGCKIA